MSKQEKILSALGNVRDEYVEESDLSTVTMAPRFRKRRILTIGIAAALCCSMALVGAALMLNRKEDNVPPADNRMVWETKYIGHDQNAETGRAEIAYIPTWDEKTIVQRYPEVQFRGVWYVESGDYTVGAGTVVPADLLGDRLGDAVLTGEDIYTDTYPQTNGAIYSIKGIDPDCAIAVLIDGEAQAYVYIDHYYTPSTLGDLVNGLALEENLTFGSAYYHFTRGSTPVTVEFPEIPEEMIWDLLAVRSAVADSDSVFESLSWRKVLSISVNVPMLGIRNLALSVTDNGYITTNILGRGLCFFIGTEKTEAFVEYVLKNCKGYELVYITDDDASEPEGVEDGVVATAVTVTGYNPNSKNDPATVD